MSKPRSIEYFRSLAQEIQPREGLSHRGQTALQALESECAALVRENEKLRGAQPAGAGPGVAEVEQFQRDVAALRDPHPIPGEPVVRDQHPNSLVRPPSDAPPDPLAVERFRNALQRLLNAHGDWVRYRRPHEEARNEDLATHAEEAERAVLVLFEAALRSGSAPAPSEERDNLREALTPLALRDCQSWGCLGTRHGCAPQRAAALLAGDPNWRDVIGVRWTVADVLRAAPAGGQT